MSPYLNKKKRQEHNKNTTIEKKKFENMKTQYKLD